MTGGRWTRIAAGSTIGYKRILAVPETRADHVRITIHEARACPLVSEIGVHRSQPVKTADSHPGIEE
jgi:alpha-L-fucosidase